jgi:hypothetical protein
MLAGKGIDKTCHQVELLIFPELLASINTRTRVFFVLFCLTNICKYVLIFIVRSFWSQPVLIDYFKLYIKATGLCPGSSTNS